MVSWFEGEENAGASKGLRLIQVVGTFEDL